MVLKDDQVFLGLPSVLAYVRVEMVVPSVFPFVAHESKSRVKAVHGQTIDTVGTTKVRPET